ncbi:unnamed protein product [Penicillium roqueforti FM164]|uniref:Genomic scaffold, ProqFM164S02 n=1 Tax=Penicillium roqueforti (strain FM164) TaxID=1365484 RepID=W6Q7H4_PENRF|nr:unnamed protein product [Penicillium roqueforti FM164]
MEASENKEQAKDTAPVTSIPQTRIPFEISDNLRVNGHSASRKRDSGHKGTKAPSTYETIPRSESHKRSRHSYEIRSRHKTREARYEYKGPSSAVETQSQCRKGRTRKSRGRKHTINDDFHAINITGNRLTLRKNMNLGMFSKGRSSCITNHPGNTPSSALGRPPSIKPHKWTAESDLAFSEMNFLSRRNNPSPYPMSTARDTLDGQNGREHHPRELQFAYPAHDSRINRSHLGNRFLDVERQLDVPVTPLFTFEKAPVSEMSAVSGHSWGTSSMFHNKRRKTSKQSSSIPYTWAETEVDPTEQIDALEQHLLSLLHVGVYPQALCSNITNTVSGRRYWSLAELWELLKERKASWSNEAGNKKRTSPEANMGQVAASEAVPQEIPEIVASDTLDLANVSSVQNEISEQSPDSNVACETVRSVNNRPQQQPPILEQQQDRPCQASDRPDCLNHQVAMISNIPDRSIDIWGEDQCEPFSHESGEHAVLFPAFAPEVKQPHISDIEFYELDRVDDDDEFYRTLDAAYCAIVRPEVAAGVASNLQRSLESPELGNNIPNSPESTGIRDYDIPTRQAEAGELEHLATVSQDIIEERYDEWPAKPSHQNKPPTSHSNYPGVDPNNDMPWLTTGYGKPLTGNDAQQSQHPEIPDFWRQNKLY